ncbi:MAG: phosphoenolpyruvate--protein phosphotransferase [Sphaerochaetaceae bacterium]
MRVMQGIAASPGIGLGQAFLYVHERFLTPHINIEEGEIPEELKRFKKALQVVAQDLAEIVKTAAVDNSEQIVETHLLMLEDPEFTKAVEVLIKEEQVCAEWAVERVLKAAIEAIEKGNDPLLRERSADINDIRWHLVKQLMGKSHSNLSMINHDVILVSDTLLPSQVLSLDHKYIKAIALDGGGKTSHVAILAQALQIPTVVGLGNITEKVRPNDQVIVDGNLGEVAIRPSVASANKMVERHAKWEENTRKLLALATEEAITTDGFKVELKANIERVEEVASVLKNGAEGVGLFRSEFLFLKPGGASEEEQFEAYKEVLNRLGKTKAVTIRTIDVGGDKIIPDLQGLSEENPILGWRAVRFCLSRKDIFRAQLRALLRASNYGKLKIMFPMISGVEELESALTILEQVKDELRGNRVPFDEEIEVGIMVEVPSAALTADILAKKTDFFSIGTNDLIQYTIAVDRGNEKIAYLYQPFHPGVLRLIQMVVEKGSAAGLPVAMCGEMASNPLAVVLLIGMGINELSMSPLSILKVKHIIRSISKLEAYEVLEEVLKMDSYLNINRYLREWMYDRFGDFFTA